ncbi:hypothetical protein L0668_04015 [Paraglaciecola aquimarina]|uniref:Uncharacterized protein n=2 Tax=Paraglaciecola algarum TaxID=3050085 RepID=A0ABS9D3D5_9ALTE|nr:hypothetical protein [Paraglaciecola sp. G1-23]
MTRNQSTQTELKQIQHAHKTLQSQNKYSLGIVMTMASVLQNTFQTKLAALKSHGLISHQDYDMAHFVLENFQFVIVQCCQHNETVEVGVRKALKGQNFTIEEISQFIARQPSEVRIPWCKNTVEGFVAACRNLVADKGKNTAKHAESAEATS